MHRIFLLLFVFVSVQTWAQKAYTISNKNAFAWAPLANGEANVHSSLTNTSTTDTSFHIQLINTNMPSAWLLGICSDASCFSVSTGFSEDFNTGLGKTTDFKCTFSFNNTAGSGCARFLIYRRSMLSLGDTVTFCTNAPATGLNNNVTKNLSASISPNPVKNDLVLVLSDNNISALSIINLVGQEVKELDFKSGKTFDVSGLPNGIYFLRITKGDASYNKKFIISK